MVRRGRVVARDPWTALDSARTAADRILRQRLAGAEPASMVEQALLSSQGRPLEAVRAQGLTLDQTVASAISTGAKPGNDRL